MATSIACDVCHRAEVATADRPVPDGWHMFEGTNGITSRWYACGGCHERKNRERAESGEPTVLDLDDGGFET